MLKNEYIDDSYVIERSLRKLKEDTMWVDAVEEMKAIRGGCK